jgi:hypothetical protein
VDALRAQLLLHNVTAAAQAQSAADPLAPAVLAGPPGSAARSGLRQLPERTYAPPSLRTKMRRQPT